jgi:hypothetical protein
VLSIWLWLVLVAAALVAAVVVVQVVYLRERIAEPMELNIQLL